MEPAHRYGQSADETIGVNVRLLREQAGLSQSELADKMTERGITWYQQTVGRVEAGRQQVRAVELDALARILKTPMNRFMWAGAEAAEAEQIASAAMRLMSRAREVSRTVNGLLEARAVAEKVLADTESSGWEQIREMREDLARKYELYTLEFAVEHGSLAYRGFAAGRGDRDAAQSES